MTKVQLLNRRRKEQILEEQTYFEYPIHLETGSVLKEIAPDGKTRVFEGVDDEGNEIIADYSEVIVLKFNKEVRDRISKYSQYILGIRGVKNINEININDGEVKKLLRERRVENKDLFGAPNLSDQDKLSAVQIVRQKHEPQYRIVIFEVIIWSMMRDDIFSAQNVKGSKALECRFEVQLADDIFNPEETEDALDDIFMGGGLKPIARDKNQPIELAIAVCKQILNDNEAFADTVADLAGVVFTHIAMLGEEAEDEGVFRDALVSILPPFMVREHTPVNGTNLRGRVQFITKETGKQTVSRNEEESSELS